MPCVQVEKVSSLLPKNIRAVMRIVLPEKTWGPPGRGRGGGLFHSSLGINRPKIARSRRQLDTIDMSSHTRHTSTNIARYAFELAFPSHHRGSLLAGLDCRCIRFTLPFLHSHFLQSLHDATRACLLGWFPRMGVLFASVALEHTTFLRRIHRISAKSSVFHPAIHCR